MDTQPLPVSKQSPSVQPLSIILILLTIIFSASTGYLSYHTIQLQKQLAIVSAPPVSPTPGSGADLSPSDVMSKIKYAGSITGIKTVNTDQWKVSTGIITENKSLDYSFQYPEKLYMVPNIRTGFKALYFFENQEGYNKYVACINDKTPVSGGSPVTRDWEGGCNGEGNLLFTVIIDFTDTRSTLSNKASDLTSYAGWGENITWTIPQKDKILSGMVPTYYADGQTPSGWISLYVVPDSETRIQSVVGIDSYTLFTHIIASFKIKS